MNILGIGLILLIFALIILSEEYDIYNCRTKIRHLKLSIDYLAQQIEELKKLKESN